MEEQPALTEATPIVFFGNGENFYTSETMRNRGYFDHVNLDCGIAVFSRPAAECVFLVVWPIISTDKDYTLYSFPTIFFFLVVSETAETAYFLSNGLLNMYRDSK